MLSVIKHLFSRWAWKMAWRDSRPVRWRLLLFSSSIIFGVAALVTIGSLRNNLNEAVESQAKSLLGADLMVGSRQPYQKPAEDWFTRLRVDGAQQSSEISFTTMLRLGEQSSPKLVNLRGIEKAFPYYGKVTTSPPDAWEKLFTTPGIIVESSFLKSMNAEVGDTARFGNTELPVLGVLLKAPPSSSGFSALSPTAVTSLDTLEQSQLVGGKSLVFYRKYFKLPPGIDPEAVVKDKAQLIAKQRLTQTTSKRRSENIEKAINRLYTFFSLIGLSALFLGGIGIAGAIHTHVHDRLSAVATLRCLGCSAARAFSVYLAQSLAMGIAGSLLGVLTGCSLVELTRIVLERLPAGLIPFEVEVSPAWDIILNSAGIGLWITLSFALLPLLAVRRVSPLAALRRADGIQQSSKRDPWRWVVMLSLVLFSFLLTYWETSGQNKGGMIALGYTFFLLVSFSVLSLSGFLLRHLAKKCSRPGWPFVLRQGIANLHRPNNQTGIFMVSIGLGVFLIFTLLLTQNILRQWLDPERMENRPNLFLVDVPPEEEQQVEQLMSQSRVKMLGNAPIVQLRLTEIKGTPVNELIVPSSGRKPIPRWILRREFRSTFRENLTDTETLLSGEWVGSVEGLQPDAAIPASFEQKLASDLGLQLGDEVTMSIEGFGESVKVRVASLREVDWRSMNLNFFIVFPKGSIDPYVSFNVLAAHSPDADATAEFQQSVFEQLPYVNSIDVSLILTTVQSVLDTAASTIRIMAMFTVFTGGIVLIASILSGRRVRVRESALLRTLGASREQMARILAVEYALLGSMATLTGAVLALVASSLLGRLVFEGASEGESYRIPWEMLALNSLSCICLIVLLGMLLSRGIAKQPPLQILRSEEMH
ncbi:ABC transporter permease [Verrucomicrobiaceae bacterium N1E253]|uniref:ABC transporter permease n=1 Tax=Oceaniferula marina TaxID=2748318 RepID=A0A851GJR0_9BACT|nr:FtsX-like permease family protein [Oceaniferula marina]NWK57252.1 ABC transporter permease [Oceaniferula marina]